MRYYLKHKETGLYLRDVSSYKDDKKTSVPYPIYSPVKDGCNWWKTKDSAESIARIWKCDVEEIYVESDDFPEFNEDADTNDLKEQLDNYIKRVSEGNQDEDDRYYIYETVMNTFYGDNIFQWINSKLK